MAVLRVQHTPGWKNTNHGTAAADAAAVTDRGTGSPASEPPESPPEAPERDAAEQK